MSKCDANNIKKPLAGQDIRNTLAQYKPTGEQQGLQAHLDDPCKNNGKALGTLGTCFARNSLLKRIQSPEDAAASGIISSVPLLQNL